MPKLHLKRTPEEEAEHQWRKERKAAKKARRSGRLSDEPSHKRRRTKYSDGTWDDKAEYGPTPPPEFAASSSKFKLDEDAIRAELEEERFRDRMWGALEDDERLDSLEARLNDYAHVPDRWRNDRGSLDNDLKVDPLYMDEEDYAEWIRMGMWRRKHADEHAEKLRKKAEKECRRAREKKVKEETARLEKAAEEERMHRRKGRELKRLDEAKKIYEQRWKDLLSGDSESSKKLGFDDIPWPIIVIHTHKSGNSVTPTDLTSEAISSFVLPPSSGVSEEGAKKERKEKLRETMLRFHPDKFEGRIMQRVREKDRDLVKEAVGCVVRALNGLMAKG